MKKVSKFSSKCLSVLLVLAMILSMIPAMAFGAAPSDIPNHWAKNTIQEWVDSGMINGYPDGTFKPENQITRAEFMKLVNSAFDYTEEAAIDYKDVPADAWYKSVVAKAKSAGYIGGYPDGTMKPENPITRQEAATIIAKIKDLAEKSDAAKTFSDVNAIPDWSKGFIGAVATAGYMQGYPDGSFKPANNIKRAEAVAALNNVLQTVSYDKAGTYGPKTGTETIKGDVFVSVKDVTLRNMIIEGDLTFGKGIGEGDATLKNVTVKGTTYVYGGGQNSIEVTDSTLGEIIVNKENGKVRIVASGKTITGQVTADSGVKLEEKNLKGDGFETLVITAPKGAKVTLVGSFDNVDVQSKDINVYVPKGTTVKTLTLDKAADVTGTGTIEKAKVNADGVTFAKAPKKIDTATGVKDPKITSESSSSHHHHSGGGDTSQPKETTVITAQEMALALAGDYDTIKVAGDIGDVTINKAVTVEGDNNEIKTINGDVIINASDVTLKNLNIVGDLILDPGPTGSVTIDSVTADNINVLSGAQNSIHLVSVTVNVELKISADNQLNSARVVTTGSTKITQTTVAANANLEQTAGSFGDITVAAAVDVNLQGTFEEDQTITADKDAVGASISTTATTTVAKLDVQSAVTVNAAGTVANVEINTESQVVLAGTGTIGAVDVQQAAQVVVIATTVTSVAVNVDNADVDIAEGTAVDTVTVATAVTTTVIENAGTITTVVTTTTDVTVTIGGNAPGKTEGEGKVTFKPRRPKAIPVAGTYALPVDVTLESSEGAKIYYTVDGITDPDETSAEYMEPIKITEETTLKAIAIYEGEEGEESQSSNILTAQYNQAQVAKVICAPKAGAIAFGRQLVLQTSTTDAVIHYTVGDGSQASPTADEDDEAVENVVYDPANKPVINAEQTYKVIAFKEGMLPSEELVLAYTQATSEGLAGLTLSEGTLDPAFANATYSYTASVPYTVTNVKVTPVAAESTITVNDAVVASGSASGDIALSQGANTITVVVTEEGKTPKTYTVTITREDPVLVTGITVTGAEDATTVANGSTLQMAAEVSPANATDKTVTWSVEAGTGTATISTTGLLTATSAGMVTVKATANDGTDMVGTLEVTITMTDTEAVADAIANLAEPATPVTANFTLPLTGANDTTISWASNNVAAIAIDGANATVTRPSVGEADANVTLTATISKGNASDTATFTVVVTATPEGITVADLEVEVIDTGLGTWVVDILVSKLTGATANSIVTLKVGDDTISMPYYAKGDSFRNGQIPKTYTQQQLSDAIVNVEMSNAQAVADAISKLAAPATPVTANFTLSLTGANDTTISWVSNNVAIAVDGANATVTRPVYQTGDATVTLTATVSKGDASDTATFTVVVTAAPEVIVTVADLEVEVIDTGLGTWVVDILVSKLTGATANSIVTLKVGDDTISMPYYAKGDSFRNGQIAKTYTQEQLLNAIVKVN